MKNREQSAFRFLVAKTRVRSLCKLFGIALMMHNSRDDNFFIPLHFENNLVWEHGQVGFSKSASDLLKDERM